MKGIKTMSEYVWCHGPNCHTYHTQDRIRGSKDNKVLRTRKIKQDSWNANNYFSHFCSQGCWNDFAYKNWDQCIAIAPRREPLETRVNVTKEEREGWNGHTYTQTMIREVDNGAQ